MATHNHILHCSTYQLRTFNHGQVEGSRLRKKEMFHLLHLAGCGYVAKYSDSASTLSNCLHKCVGSFPEPAPNSPPARKFLDSLQSQASKILKEQEYATILGESPKYIQDWIKSRQKEHAGRRQNAMQVQNMRRKQRRPRRKTNGGKSLIKE